MGISSCSDKRGLTVLAFVLVNVYVIQADLSICPPSDVGGKKGGGGDCSERQIKKGALV